MSLTVGAIAQLSGTGVSTNADLLLFLVVGVLAGAHCLGMCGPLVSVYADRVSAKTAARRETLTPFEVRQHALFNLGRTAGYATVGAAFGLLGGTLFASIDAVAAVGASVRAATGLTVGLFIFVAGMGYLLGGARGTTTPSLPFLSAVFGRVSRVLTSRVDRLAGSTGILALGGVHAVLPCPIIYPAYLYAFAIGDPLRGGLSLAALGIGTFPTLFAYGTMVGTLDASQRAGLHRLLGAAFVVLAYVPISHGLILLGVDVPHVPLPFYQPLT